MASSGRSQARNLKLPSILESIAQLERMEPNLPTYCKLPYSRQHRPGAAYPDITQTSCSADMPDPSSVRREDDGDDEFVKTSVNQRPCVYQCPSPGSDFKFGNVNDCHSSASISSCSGTSTPRSRSSNSMISSLSRECANSNDAKIGSTYVGDVYKNLAKILDSSQAEKACDSKEKHKLDERRRRDMHKKLQGQAEDLCRDMLDRLPNSNIESQREDLDPQLVRAMMTGNHKKHHTKTAIQLALILQLLHQATSHWNQTKYIQSLEREIVQLRNGVENAEISTPTSDGANSPPSSTNKRRKSSFIVHP